VFDVPTAEELIVATLKRQRSIWEGDWEVVEEVR
jgi:hypothetical protein